MTGRLRTFSTSNCTPAVTCTRKGWGVNLVFDDRTLCEKNGYKAEFILIKIHSYSGRGKESQKKHCGSQAASTLTTPCIYRALSLQGKTCTCIHIEPSSCSTRGRTEFVLRGTNNVVSIRDLIAIHNTYPSTTHNKSTLETQYH